MMTHLTELEDDIAFQFIEEEEQNIGDFTQSTCMDEEEDIGLICTYDQLKERQKSNSLFELIAKVQKICESGPEKISLHKAISLVHL